MKKIDRELWEKLDKLVVLCGQKKIREYIESQPDTIPYVRDLKYMFRVLRGKEKCDEERFKCILNRLRYWYDYYSFDSVERVRKDMDALTYSCPIDVDDKSGPISERMRFYVRDSADKLSGKDGFTLSCFVDGNISEEFEKFFFNGKEYELTVCEFGRVIKWNDVVIKQENGEWCRYNIDGKCEVISKEKLKTMLNNSIFIGSIKHSGLTYSVK